MVLIVLSECVNNHEAIINMIINAIGAFATVSTVIVALCLGLRETRKKIKITAALANIQTDSKERIECIMIKCTNHSKYTIFLNHFFFKDRKNTYLILDPQYTSNKQSTTLPCKLHYGESADVFVNLYSLQGNNKKFSKKYKWIEKLKLKFFLKVGVDSDFKEFLGKPDNALIERVLELRVKGL